MPKSKISTCICGFEVPLLIILVCVCLINPVFSQQRFTMSKSTFYTSQNNDKLLSLQDISQWAYCEEALVRMAEIVDNVKEGDDPLIIILHLANGEQNKLFKNRYNVINTYLKKQLINEKYIIAQGNRVRENGRADFYIKGKLFWRLGIRKNSPSVCVK